MHGICRLLGAIAIAAGAWHAADLKPATAQVTSKQIPLTEEQVERFIAAQGKMSAAKAEDELEAVAREYGFTDLDEHDDVEANILLLLEGIHPQSRTFVEPPEQIRRRIEEVKVDKSLPEDGRHQALEDLAEALKSAQPIRFPANVELVRKHYDKIQAVLQ